MYEVSIPYRLATNRNAFDGMLYFTAFQFLIGWLQTKHFLPAGSREFWFQFLIGWLQTVDDYVQTPLTPRFNSL